MSSYILLFSSRLHLTSSVKLCKSSMTSLGGLCVPSGRVYGTTGRGGGLVELGDTTGKPLAANGRGLGVHSKNGRVNSTHGCVSIDCPKKWHATSVLKYYVLI